MDMGIGEKIRKIREGRNMTQSELAEKSGLSRVSIGNYERCYRIPDAIAIKKIAYALNVDIKDLYSDIKQEVNNIMDIKEVLKNQIKKLEELQDKSISRHEVHETCMLSDRIKQMIELAINIL